MGKSRKNSILNSVKKTSNKLLPIVDTGLQKVGSTAKDVAKISIPIAEKGVSAVYGTMATGFDLGVKGVKGVNSVARGMTKSKRSKRNLKGGRKGGRSRKLKSKRNRSRY
jgi:hypothetical protein